jgi:hypothetical protein
MKILAEKTKLMFLKLLNEDLSIIDFENWVYNNSDYLKEELNFDFYLYLISFDYRQKSALSEIRDKIITFNFLNIDKFNILSNKNIDELHILRIKKLLNEIIYEKINFVIAIIELHSLYHEIGEDLIPMEFADYYNSELDDVPLPSSYHLYNKNFLEEKLKKLDLYKDDIIKDAKKMLGILNNMKSYYKI